jgi:hypothetical protein
MQNVQKSLPMSYWAFVAQSNDVQHFFSQAFLELASLFSQVIIREQILRARRQQILFTIDIYEISWMKWAKSFWRQIIARTIHSTKTFSANNFRQFRWYNYIQNKPASLISGNSVASALLWCGKKLGAQLLEWRVPDSVVLFWQNALHDDEEDGTAPTSVGEGNQDHNTWTLRVKDREVN